MSYDTAENESNSQLNVDMAHLPNRTLPLHSSLGFAVSSCTRFRTLYRCFDEQCTRISVDVAPVRLTCPGSLFLALPSGKSLGQFNSITVLLESHSRSVTVVTRWSPRFTLSGAQAWIKGWWYQYRPPHSLRTHVCSPVYTQLPLAQPLMHGI